MEKRAGVAAAQDYNGFSWQQLMETGQQWRDYGYPEDQVSPTPPPNITPPPPQILPTTPLRLMLNASSLLMLCTSFTQTLEVSCFWFLRRQQWIYIQRRRHEESTGGSWISVLET